MYPYPELYILRHGETLWNQQGRFQGQKDSPLTDKGRRQALAQGEVLRSVKSLPHIVFVSPLGRTLTTAILAAPFIKTHVKDPRLLEINFGAWEGATRDAVATSMTWVCGVNALFALLALATVIPMFIARRRAAASSG